MADYRVGRVNNPRVPLATAVAASSAFPPFLSPLTLEIDAKDYEPPSGRRSEDLHADEYMTKVRLTDGGVYDNLGLETAWKNHEVVWVSDGGGKLEAEKSPKTDWIRHLMRVTNTIDNQVRSLRKRLLIESYQRPQSDPSYRQGAYWGIRQNMAVYRLSNKMHCPFDRTRELADESTRLASLSESKQNRLINWGYAICDVSMRTWYDQNLTAPSDPNAFPCAGGV